MTTNNSSLENKKIYIAGHRGMVGSALVRKFKALGFSDKNLITASKMELDLRDQNATSDFLNTTKPDMVIIAAAKVGGIGYNASHPADFIYDNLAISTNLIHSSYTTGIQRLLFLGSSCIYPKMAPQPISEDSLLTSGLEPTNEAYALAKISALKMCAFYRQQYGVCYHSVMPTNLYGIGDTYDINNSHVIPSLILKFHNAKINNHDSVTIWGTGTPRREFLFADDLADACFHVLNISDPPEWVNVGSGIDIPIIELAHKIASVVGYKGKIKTDPTKPDGTPKKLLNSSLMNYLGWKPKTTLEEGLKIAYKDFLSRLN